MTSKKRADNHGCSQEKRKGFAARLEKFIKNQEGKHGKKPRLRSLKIKGFEQKFDHRKWHITAVTSDNRKVTLDSSGEMTVGQIVDAVVEKVVAL